MILAAYVPAMVAASAIGSAARTPIRREGRMRALQTEGMITGVEKA